MVSQVSSIAFWAVALCFLRFAVLSNASDTPRHPHAKRDDEIHRRCVVSKSTPTTCEEACQLETSTMREEALVGGLSHSRSDRSRYQHSGVPNRASNVLITPISQSA
jgi:hypothetical protein